MIINKINVQTKRKVNDNQWMTKECEIIDPSILTTINSDEFGGNKDVNIPGSNYFSLANMNDRFFLTNKNGNQYIFSGVSTVRSSVQSNNKASFDSKYGSLTKWSNSTIDFLRDKKIYGIGAWSDYSTINGTNSEKKLNYTILLYLTESYATSVGKTSSGTGHLNYKSDVIPIFDYGYQAFIDKKMATFAKHSTDPYLIGYFTDNELPFHKKSLDNFLKLDKLDPNRLAAENWLNGQYDKTVTDTNRDKFLVYLVSTYSKIMYMTIRKYDKNHLIFGPRIYGSNMSDQNVWLGLSFYTDIISINYYSDWFVMDNIIAIAEALNKPFIVSEFYVKGIDSGLGNTSGAGWIVKTQTDRGYFYQNFVIKLLKSKLCVGWNWLQYMDNNPLGSTDPSNVDSNKGLVTIQYAPYTSLLDQMRLVNRNIYKLIEYLD